MVHTNKDLFEALQQYFGFKAFKGQQEEIVSSVLNKKDTFVIMPTGGGKSLCYQLPALIMEGTAIVISPLIALMKNQVDSIRNYAQSDDVAHFLNSSLSRTQVKKVKEDISNGKTKLLYIAPETLTKEENINFFNSINLSFVAVDEAHCISEWGHDFRPDYRNIRKMIDAISSNIHVIALTATATPKVQADIIKNLNLQIERKFISSFNRTNLYYEIAPKGKKELVIKNMIQRIKRLGSTVSGIIYVQSRKSTEEISKLLQVNGIKAAPYHAGLDAKTRSSTQDGFLMEDIEVIVATIAFGMGIDKPDVRFVFHYDIPKSIENYYQETGRAGRDGLNAECVAYYSYKDILKLEKFLRDKPVAEREMSMQLMQDVMAYAETASCRRRFLLHYFGEKYDDSACETMCDNCKHPKDKIDVSEEMSLALKVVSDLGENYKIRVLADFFVGNASMEIKDAKLNNKPNFGAGKDKDLTFWFSVFRHALLNEWLKKDIESYGILKLTPKGRDFMAKPEEVKIPINTDFDRATAQADEEGSVKNTVLDEVLLRALKDLRKKISKEKNLPPFVIFQDPSLIDMATHYPINMEEMANIVGVSKGKALRYGKQFASLIQRYVEENNIERPIEFVVKQVANKSKIKVNIIQGIDRKIPLTDIADSNSISLDALLDEMYAIVNSGTRLDIEYDLEENMDEYSKEDITDYFMEAETDDLETALKELEEDDITLEEIKMVRIAFLSSMAN